METLQIKLAYNLSWLPFNWLGLYGITLTVLVKGRKVMQNTISSLAVAITTPAAASTTIAIITMDF